jgi:branched-chain amino acid transport system substrate-binding protein
MTKRSCIPVALLLFATACSAVSAAPKAIDLGAVYPLNGSQGVLGTQEYDGVKLAVERVNSQGGVNGRPVALRFAEADSADQGPVAVQQLASAGVPLILGSHGSTISAPAADAATRLGRVFWETGAVGTFDRQAIDGGLTLRFAPTGWTLGSAGVSFLIQHLLPMLHQNVKSLRYSVAYVDDEYGRSVGFGALDEVRKYGLTLAGSFVYDPHHVDTAKLARRIAAVHTDVLMVSQYLEDGVALRRAMVRQHVRLVASVGTSSSYCMHLFGQMLGKDAVGLFASDKPDAGVLNPAKLDPDAATQLRWANAQYEQRYKHTMTAPALTGFAGAWALLHYVLPAARTLRPADIVTAARATKIPVGGLPNGSGLDFAHGVENAAAISVIWEWVRPRVRAIVWPPAFATSPIIPLPIS